jgi:small subunit ribosomal protein S21
MAVGAKLQEGENFDQLFRRFKKLVGREGILNDYRKHLVYEKPSEIRKKREIAKMRKIRRMLEKVQKEEE